MGKRNQMEVMYKKAVILNKGIRVIILELFQLEISLKENMFPTTGNFLVKNLYLLR
jgi:hypothetical protein